MCKETKREVRKDMSKLIVDIPKELHKKIRIKAIKEDKTLKKLVTEILKREVR